MNAVLDAARRELQRGRQPIPIPVGQKRPVKAGWQDLRLTDDDLDKHFRGASNLAVLNGTPSGDQVDVDLDCAEALLLADQFLPATGSIFGRQGKRRSHRLYVCDPLPPTTQFRDVDGTMLLELRSTGTQTLFPPSIHPGGEQITWDKDAEPRHLVGDDLVAAVTRTAAGCLLARNWPAEGSRQDAALALAGGLLRLGWSEDDVTSFIEGVASAAGDEETSSRIATVDYTMRRLQAGQLATGWTRLAELVGDSVVTRARGWLGVTNSEDCEDSEAVWESPVPFAEGPRPPFPTDVFPDWLRDYVNAVALFTQTPTALAGLMVLACLAVACAKMVVVQLRHGWQEPINLFTVTAMSPAERKSAVFAEVTRPLRAFEVAEMKRLAPSIAEAEGRRSIAEQELAKARKDAALAKPADKPALLKRADELARALTDITVPVMPQLIVEDCTPERVASILAEQSGRLAVMAPEGDVFDLMAGRYSANGGPNFGVYLKGHAGDDLRVDRVGRPREIVQAPALTVGLAVQPGVLQGLLSRPDFRARGLPARFLYGMPESRLGHRDCDPPSVPEVIRHSYDSHLSALLQMAVSSIGADGKRDPRPLLLAPEAAAAFLSFQRALEPRLGELGDLGALQDWGGKLAGAVARIAGLLHLAVHAKEPSPWNQEISLETMLRAIRLTDDFLIPHALVAFAHMGADPAIADARHVLRVLIDRQLQTFAERDLFQLVKGRFKTMAALAPVLGVLQRHGYIRIQDAVDRFGPGRRPSPVYDVHPQALEEPVRLLSELPASSALAVHTPASPSSSTSHNPHNPHIRDPWSDNGRSEDCEDCEHPSERQEIVEWAVPL